LKKEENAMYDFGADFYVDMLKSKTPSQNVFKGKTYRISIISDVLIRFEYSETGSFNDFPTFFASNRSFGKPKFQVEEDNNILNIKNEHFIIEYKKEKPFAGSKFLPDQNLRVTITNTEKLWHFNHPEVKNFMGTSYSLDNSKGTTVYDKGLFSLDGFTSFDDSRTPILNKYGNIIAPNYKNIDTYLFVYNNDFGVGLRDYFNLTSLPPLIPRYALGVWWSKNEHYHEGDIQQLVNNFRKYEIPISVLMLGDYARKANKYSTISFSFDKTIFPNAKALSEFLHKNNISLGANLKTEGIISVEEERYQDFSKLYAKDQNKNIPLNVYDSKLVDSFLKTLVTPFLNDGVDFLWIDDNNKDNTLRSFAMNYFLFNNFSINKSKRNFLISRNFGICPHKYSALYSGNTLVSWKTLKLLPFFNATAANIGVSWWSHDIGGYKGGTEDGELYMRYVQLGVYSPIFRLSSEAGKYYKREPWKWDAKTYKIVHDYTRIRHKLIPYLYSEAKKYSSFGSPLIQPLYYKYPETYDEPLYKNEFYFGSELFVAPITDPKDDVMNRVVHRIFLPNGVWYDFKTGKKFIGGKRYVTFYKDEDYPVYAKTGAIIPLAKLESNNLNDTSSPKTLEIQIFPGRSNTFKLYEDDGISSMYKDGYSFTTEINYYYKENDFSVSIEPIEGKVGIIPEKRNYIIRFRNTKFTDNVQVFCNEVNVPYRRYTDDNDFVYRI
jgi:alpha-glucosidase (family GH31 glycosyl hydrolase)